jgi:hypothetical protein
VSFAGVLSLQQRKESTKESAGQKYSFAEATAHKERTLFSIAIALAEAIRCRACARLPFFGWLGFLSWVE